MFSPWVICFADISQRITYSQSQVPRVIMCTDKAHMDFSIVRTNLRLYTKFVLARSAQVNNKQFADST